MGWFDEKIVSEKAKVQTPNFHIQWKKVLAFAFFLLLSATFWVILVLRQNFEASVQVPVKYVNTPDSILFKNELPTKIGVSVSDKGLALFRSIYLNDKDTIEINVRNFIQAKNTLIKDDQLVQLIKSKFEKTTALLRYAPARISLEFSPLKSKRVPVIFDGVVNTTPDFRLNGDIQVTPDSVTAYSSDEVLKSMDVAFTVNDKYSDLNKNTVLDVPLRNDKKVRFSPQTVRVSIPVAEFAQRELSVPVRCLNVPAGMDVVFFPSNVTVSFAVALSRFNDITPDDFNIDLDFNELMKTTEGVIRLRLTGSPSFIDNISIKPASVEFILEKNKNNLSVHRGR